MTAGLWYLVHEMGSTASSTRFARGRSTPKFIGTQKGPAQHRKIKTRDLILSNWSAGMHKPWFGRLMHHNVTIERLLIIKPIRLLVCEYIWTYYNIIIWTFFEALATYSSVTWLSTSTTTTPTATATATATTTTTTTTKRWTYERMDKLHRANPQKCLVYNSHYIYISYHKHHLCYWPI